VWCPTYQYTLAAYVFVPSVFGENIPTAKSGMISAETACGDRKKMAKFLMKTFPCRSSLYSICLRHTSHMSLLRMATTSLSEQRWSFQGKRKEF